MMNMQKNINAEYAGNIYFWVIQCHNKGNKSWKINVLKYTPTGIISAYYFLALTTE